MTSLYFTPTLRSATINLAPLHSPHTFTPPQHGITPPPALYLRFAPDDIVWAHLLTPATYARAWRAVVRLEDRWDGGRGDYPADQLAQAYLRLAPLTAHAAAYFDPAEVDYWKAEAMRADRGDAVLVPLEAEPVGGADAAGMVFDLPAVGTGQPQAPMVYDGRTGRFGRAG